MGEVFGRLLAEAVAPRLSALLSGMCDGLEDAVKDAMLDALGFTDRRRMRRRSSVVTLGQAEEAARAKKQAKAAAATDVQLEREVASRKQREAELLAALEDAQQRNASLEGRVTSLTRALEEYSNFKVRCATDSRHPNQCLRIMAARRLGATGARWPAPMPLIPLPPPPDGPPQGALMRMRACPPM